MSDWKFSIVTPCYNAEQYIAETIQSVLGQNALASGRATLEYTICDGQSTDKTIPIIEAFDSPFITVMSEPDKGMYDALVKGLRCSSGNIVAYLNADDYFNPYAFDMVIDIFEQKEAQWVTGYQAVYSDSSYPVYFRLPFRFRSELIGQGFYGNILPSISQESTFWSAELNTLIDFDYLSTLQLAGDYYLWSQFAKVTELKIIEGFIGGYRRRPGQLSEDMIAYREEMQQISSAPTWRNSAIAFFDKFVWLLPSKFKKMLNANGLYRYDFDRCEWV